MVIFLYGPDTYRSRQKLNEIISSYQEAQKKGLNLKYFNGEELFFDEFRDEISQPSMFAEKKLLILKDIFSNAKFKDDFLKNYKNLDKLKDVILFYESKEVLKSDTFFKLLKKIAKAQEFEFLAGQSLKNWVKKEVEKYQAKISPEAIDKLINFVGNDSWLMSNEIQKLVNYRKSKNIQAGDIEILTRPKIETDIFKTIDAISLKNKQQALALLHRHLEKGDSPLYLLSMINFQFRNLLEIKNLIEKKYPYYAIFKKSKLHPFIIKKSFEQSKKFTFQELKKIYQKIFQVDINIKTGRIEPETALDLLVAEI